MTTDRKFAKELRFRSAIWTVALLVVLASVADAQATSADSPASADPSASLEPSAKTNGTVSSQEQHAPEDLWNRGTPRGAVSSFLDAARDGRWDDATALLDLSAMPDDERATRGSELARKLKYLLDQGLWIELDTLSEAPEGDLEDGLSPAREFVGSLQTASDGRVFLDRKPREDGVPVWRFSAGTLGRVPALYARLGPPRIVDALPAMFVNLRFLDIVLWQWVAPAS